MDDHQFLTKINSIAARASLDVGPLPAFSETDPEAVAAWAEFLQSCVKKGVTLSDPRWKRLTVRGTKADPRFSLEPAKPGGPDDEFRLGLQLLMGMMDSGPDG